MTTPSEPEPERTELSTQVLPAIPTVEEMKTWDPEKVLRWIQQRPGITLKGDNLEIFKKGDIGGIAFLASDVEFYRTCGLPRGVGLTLEDLAKEVEEGSRATGRKRKGDDSSERSNSPKRYRPEELLSKLATKASERRKLIRETIMEINSSSNQYADSTDPFPNAVDLLSDPTYQCTLPFPFIGFVAPKRFNSLGQTWQYVGRTKFKELLQALKEVLKERYTTLKLYGTQGYGKSHLLAALVCYLAAQDERVVYIPDCRAWLENPVQYMQAAMLFAWADDTTTQEEIMALHTEDEITAFFRLQEKALIVVDQENELTQSNPRKEAKCAQLDHWLVLLAFRHKKVYSSSANDMNFHDQASKQNYDLVLSVYGGLDDAEMAEWWKRHNIIQMGDYTRLDVEDVTGRIPLLLDKCVVDKKIDLTGEDMRDIYENAAGFVQDIRDRTTGHKLYWQWYLNYVTACFRQSGFPSGWHPKLVDHRYFYRLNGSGRCVCGLARNAVTEQLLQRGDDFIDTDSLVSLRELINNPSVVGFMMEHAILSSIRSNGLAINAGIMRPMKVRLLAQPYDIKTTIEDEPVLYWPRKFNFAAIDGIIVLINPKELDDEKNAQRIAQKIAKRKTPQGLKTGAKDMEVERHKLLMFPIKITLSRAGHADSHEKFFENYSKWTKHLSRFDVETQFIWITPSDRGFQMHPYVSKNRPAHIERYIPFEDVSTAIWQRYQDAMGNADAAQAEPIEHSTASGKVTADETSLEEEEVTAAASSTGLRVRTSALQHAALKSDSTS